MKFPLSSVEVGKVVAGYVSVSFSPIKKVEKRAKVEAILFHNNARPPIASKRL